MGVISTSHMNYWGISLSGGPPGAADGNDAVHFKYVDGRERAPTRRCAELRGATKKNDFSQRPLRLRQKLT